MELLADKLQALSARRGEDIAVVCGSRRVSYAELASAVEYAAAAWLCDGLQRGDRVALILQNCVEAIVACYAVWRAGGVVVPMNAQAKSRDYEHWLAHSGARYLVYEASDKEVERSLALLAIKPKCIVVGTASESVSSGGAMWADWLATQGYNGVEQRARVEPAELALLLYTSGTTGRPKAVMLSHENLSANVAAIAKYLKLTHSDSIVSVLPFYYSYGSSVLHTHLFVGARLVIERNLVFPHAVVETLARERATGFSGVPSTYALLLSRVPLAKYDLSALRYLTQAGGAMAPSLTMRLLETMPQAQLFVMYGQTEATARLTYLPPEYLREKLGSVGVGISGVQIEVRDEHGQVAPSGVIGDIWARGPNVMMGYWQDPAATSAALKDGWLKTGDMGHMDADGYLFLSGRRGDMIKAGAHRVHPKDVEEVIAELPSVAEVAVVGVEDELLGQVIKAFIVPVEVGQLDVNAVKAHCRERLAIYKIPKYIELVADLPKTASGKVRRAELAG